MKKETRVYSISERPNGNTSHRILTCGNTKVTKRQQIAIPPPTTEERKQVKHVTERRYKYI